MHLDVYGVRKASTYTAYFCGAIRAIIYITAGKATEN